ncbi:MAG: dTDP-4-dehydrorhamnose reductase, partial [Janthinobacterium lividum]
MPPDAPEPAKPLPTPPVAVWGGAECSVVRLHDAWRDQTRETGHHDRFDDLARIAAMGIRTVRAAVLWERCVPGPAHCGWTWHDARMAEMRRLGLAPVVGLMHHGSGPPGT